MVAMVAIDGRTRIASSRRPSRGTRIASTALVRPWNPSLCYFCGRGPEASVPVAGVMHVVALPGSHAALEVAGLSVHSFARRNSQKTCIWRRVRDRGRHRTGSVSKPRAC
jgi:hypothetical protein